MTTINMFLSLVDVARSVHALTIKFWVIPYIQVSSKSNLDD